MKNTTNIRVPKKYQHMLDEVFIERDELEPRGIRYMFYTADGFCIGDHGCHTRAEETTAALREAIRMIEPCDCDDACKAAQARLALAHRERREAKA